MFVFMHVDIQKQPPGVAPQEPLTLPFFFSVSISSLAAPELSRVSKVQEFIISAFSALVLQACNTVPGFLHVSSGAHTQEL